MKKPFMEKLYYGKDIIAPALWGVLMIAAGSAYANCSSPTGKEGDIFYNVDYHTYQFCNGTTWNAYGGGGTCTTSSGYAVTKPLWHRLFCNVERHI